MKVLGLITARGGSKGIPGKNIIPVAGKPLIYYTISASLASKHITKTLVSSDSDEILSIAKDYGADIIKRPAELSTDTSNSESAINHCLEHLKNNGDNFDLIVLLQPTSPLRNNYDIDNAIEALINSEATALISVFEPEHSPYKAVVLKPDGYIKGIIDDDTQFKRRQDLPKVFLPNGAIYIIYVNEFMKNQSLITDRTIPFLMSANKSIDIDSPESVKAVENELSKLSK